MVRSEPLINGLLVRQGKGDATRDAGQEHAGCC